MQAFQVLWLRWLLVAILLGLAGALTALLGVHLLARPNARAAEREEIDDYPAEIRVGGGGVPALLVLLYIATIIFMVVYATFAGLGRMSY